MRKPKLCLCRVPFLLALVNVRAQLSVPEMPGPPYPDRWGNNRWGVKYDPLIHGRGGRSHESYVESSPELYRPSHYTTLTSRSPRSKWTPGAKPVVSSSPKNTRRRRPASLSSLDSAMRKPPVDYLSRYSDGHSKSSHLASIENFFGPSKQYRPVTNIDRSSRGSRRSSSRSSRIIKRSDVADNPNKGSLKSSYLSLLPTGTDVPDADPTPQTDFFKPAPQISKKTSFTRNFAKTLSKLYNDYKPGGENAGSGISTSSSSKGSGSTSSTKDILSLASDNDESSHDDLLDSRLPPPGPSPSRVPPPPGFRKGPSTGKRPYIGGGRRPGSTFSSYSSRSPYDLSDDDFSSSSGGFSSSSPFDSIDYSDSPSLVYSSSSSGGPGFGSGFSSSSGGPVRVSSYTMSGPSPFDSFDSYDLGPGPFGDAPLPPLPPPPPPPPPIIPAVNPLQLASAPLTLGSSNLLTPTLVITPGGSSSKKKERHRDFRPISFKRKNPLTQAHPILLARELLRGPNRGRRNHFRDHYREKERESDDKEESQKQTSFAINLTGLQSQPLLASPPQYAYNPLVNALSSGFNPYFGAPHPYPYPAYPFGNYPYPAPAPAPAPPPPPPPVPLGPISAGLLTLRDTITSVSSRHRPYYRLPPPPPPPPPPPRPSRLPPPSSTTASDGDILISSDSKKEPNVAGPITQHLQDWPRIFTAMGSSVDAVAGGIHAVRKEISKATGQTIAKGIMMSGSAVHEVTKGMAHVITKMSTI